MPVSEHSKQVAMRTSRAKGAVGANAVVPRIVREFIRPHHTVLDYGAGKDAAHANALKQQGFNVTAYDYHEHPEHHDPEALNRRYHIVYASNVLNTQETKADLARTLNEIANSVHPAGGMAIFNLPTSPRKGAFQGMTITDANDKLERAVKRRFRNVVRHPLSTSQNPIWIARDPLFHAPKRG